MEAALAAHGGDASVRGRFALAPLAREALARVATGPAAAEEGLARFAAWHPVRQDRRWIASRAARAMQAMLGFEIPGARPVPLDAAGTTLVRRVLSAMGLAAGDWEPPAPPGGLLEIPASLSWWTPVPVDLETTLDALAAGHAPELAPPDAHSLNCDLLRDADRLTAAARWYEEQVLPYIDDYGAHGGGVPDIGRSHFSSAVPYAAQHPAVHGLLWALADTLLAHELAMGGHDGAALRACRLPLIRAIWDGEVNAVIERRIGPAPLRGSSPADALVGWSTRYEATHRDVLRGVRAILHLPATDAVDEPDRLTALQIALAARTVARGKVPAAAASGGGCAASALVLLALPLALLATMR